MCSDIGLNWEIILETAYCQKKKILLLLKAGMGMEILHQLNHSIDAVDEQYKLRIAAWNGIIFNIILYCADRGFSDSPRLSPNSCQGCPLSSWILNSQQHLRAIMMRGLNDLAKCHMQDSQVGPAR